MRHRHIWFFIYAVFCVAVYYAGYLQGKLSPSDKELPNNQHKFPWEEYNAPPAFDPSENAVQPQENIQHKISHQNLQNVEKHRVSKTEKVVSPRNQGSQRSSGDYQEVQKVEEHKKELKSQEGVPLTHQGRLQAAGDGKNLLKDTIHLSLVCCGNRYEETTVVLKSAAMFTQAPLHFHIFAEDKLQIDIANKLNKWPATFKRNINFTMYAITFPSGESHKEWKKLFLNCASQRLFMPDVMKDVDSVLYVDTDVLFLRSLEDIWSFFKEFNTTQFAGMAPCHEDAEIGWYKRFARHPYYGPNGLNSGVFLMNLTRIRAYNWTNIIIQIYRDYKTKIEYGDQDLLNILFYFLPECLYVFPCEWNFRPDACQYGLNCHRINDHGLPILHGNRQVFHKPPQNPFQAIYGAFKSYQLGTDFQKSLIEETERKLSHKNLKNKLCTKALLEPVMETLRESVSIVSSRPSKSDTHA